MSSRFGTKQPKTLVGLLCGLHEIFMQMLENYIMLLLLCYSPHFLPTRKENKLQHFHPSSYHLSTFTPISFALCSFLICSYSYPSKANYLGNVCALLPYLPALLTEFSFHPLCPHSFTSSTSLSFFPITIETCS